MKKTRYAFLLLCLFTSAALNAQITGNALKVDSVTVSAEQSSVSVPISISVEEPFAGYQFTLNYNPDILDCQSVKTGSFIPDFNILSDIKTPGVIKAGGFDPSLKGISGSGTIILVTFEITGSGTSPLSLSGAKLSDKEGKYISFRLISGRVTVRNNGDEPVQTEGGESSDKPDDGEPASPVPASRGVPLHFTAGGDISTAASRETVKTESEERHLPARTPVQRTPAVRPPPEIPVPATSPNRILLVRSEYGNPSPPAGMTTYVKGQRVTAEVEKEVLVSEMEKAVCVGAKGEGSFSSAHTNRTAFNINEDTILAWQWQRMPSDRDFLLELKEEIDISDFDREGVIEIPVGVKHYGGLTEPVKFSIVETPGFIEARFEKKETAYRKGGNTVILEMKSSAPAGKHLMKFEAACGGIKKEHRITINIPAEVKKTVAFKDNRVELTLKLEDNIKDFASYRLKVLFPGKLVHLEEILPQTVRYKMAGRGTLALAGSCSERIVTISFSRKKNFQEVEFDIKSFTVLNKTGSSVPVCIIGE